MLRLYICHGPHCNARGCAGIRAACEQALWQAGLLAEIELCPSGCQDHCDHGPNMLVQPGAIRYYGLTTERIARIIDEHLCNNRPVTEYLARPEMRRS